MAGLELASAPHVQISACGPAVAFGSAVNEELLSFTAGHVYRGLVYRQLVERLALSDGTPIGAESAVAGR